MPLVEKPKNQGPLFGDGVQILIGGPLVRQLREWKANKAASPATDGVVSQNSEDQAT